MNTTRIFGLGLAAGLTITLTIAATDTDPTPAPTEHIDPLSEQMWEIDTATDHPDHTPQVEPAPTTEPTEPTTTEAEVPVDLEPTPTPDPEPEQVEDVIEIGTPSMVANPQIVVHEDDPEWDCRIHGNRTCGVEIEGTWYVISFDEHGQPSAVDYR